jgi:hypothetical protein
LLQIADGTVKFTVRDSRLNSLLEILYPVGSIKITVSSTAPFSDLGFGTWEEVSKGRVLWGADDSHAAGSTIEAGLPNIKGRLGPMDDMSSETVDGVFYRGDNRAYDAKSDLSGDGWCLGFDASRSSSVYGKSDTVTPPSYVVHFWQRVS